MNPFVQSFDLEVIKINTQYYETKTANITDGIIGKYKRVEESYLVEKQEKMSVFEIPFIENVLFKEIKSNGRDLLLFIMYNLQKETDYISLKPDRTCNQMDIVKATYYSAIRQLMDIAVICKKSGTDYWVNPRYLYKGSRLDYYNKNYKEQIKIVAEVVKK